MSAEARKEFEMCLQVALKEIKLPFTDLKVGKKKLIFGFQEKKCGELYLQHLKKADAYYAGVEIYSCDALDFCLSQNPPYASRLLNQSFFSMSSLGEVDKCFGDEIGGVIRTPSAENIPLTINKIQERLNAFYLPRIYNCIAAQPEILQDVIKSPNEFAYPFLSALYVAYKNNMAFDTPAFQRVACSRDVLGKKDFDLELAKRILPAI